MNTCVDNAEGGAPVPTNVLRYIGACIRLYGVAVLRSLGVQCSMVWRCIHEVDSSSLCCEPRSQDPRLTSSNSRPLACGTVCS